MRSLIITACVILASLAANAQTAKTDSAKTASIVFVNSDSLINNYDYYKVVKAKLEDLSQRAQAELNAKGVAFQKEVAAYQKSASALTPMQKAATEKRLAKKQQDLEALSQNTAKQLQDKGTDQNSQLYDRIALFLKGYSKLKGYKLVLTYSKANPSLLYGDDGLDITKDVVAGLNAEFKKEAK